MNLLTVFWIWLAGAAFVYGGCAYMIGREPGIAGDYDEFPVFLTAAVSAIWPLIVLAMPFMLLYDLGVSRRKRAESGPTSPAPTGGQEP